MGFSGNSGSVITMPLRADSTALSKILDLSFEFKNESKKSVFEGDKFNLLLFVDILRPLEILCKFSA
jgi:hypothetical protein